MSFLVRLRPTGPWRIGPQSGSRDITDLLYRADALYSAVTHAMRYLGLLEDWLAATAANPAGSSVRFTSCFPYVEGALLIAPPRTLWPPAPSAKLRWKSASFVPLPVVEALLAGQPIDEEAYAIDGPSESLIPAGQPGPFRISSRRSAAVDRLTGTAAPFSTSCLEFSPNAGLWCLVDAPEAWIEPVKAAFRWLADSGFGGERARGWGRSEAPIFEDAPALLSTAAEAHQYWLLAPYSPAPEDPIAWDQGNYHVVTRGGWVADSASAKKLVRMIAEGSVLHASAPPLGSAPNVAPEGFAHPVYRAGFAYAIPLPTPEVTA